MADSAIDSLFSQYHSQLWECYRLLAYAYRGDENCAQEMENFMKPYVEDCGWYSVSAPEVSPVRKTFLTDGGGVWFEQEILDYMKYGWINVQLTPESAEKLWKELKEAQTMNSILKDYGGESRELEASSVNGAIIDALIGYRVSPMFHLYAYNRTNTNDYTRIDLPYKQGAGMKLTKDFDRWGDLFKSKKNKKKKK